MITHLYTAQLRPRSQQVVMVTQRQAQATKAAVYALQNEQAIPSVDGVTIDGDTATIIFSEPIPGRCVFIAILDRACELLGASSR